MAPKTSKELATEYLALINKHIHNHKKVAELASAWVAKQIAKAHRNKDEDKYLLKHYQVGN